jgi:chromosome segregation ATPase
LLIERDTTKRAVEESEAKVQELEEELKEVRASTEARVADLQREAAIYKRELGKERSEEDGAKFQIRRLKLRVAEVSSLKTEAENRLQSVLSSILQVAGELEAVHREFKLCQIRSLEGLSHLAAASVEIQQQYQKHLSSLKEFLVSTPDGVLCIALAVSCTFDVFRWP